MASATDTTHAEYASQAEATGAAALAHTVYQRYTGQYPEDVVADKIMATLRRKGYSYALASHIAWQYS